jgi:hypothetical protein
VSKQAGTLIVFKPQRSPSKRFAAATATVPIRSSQLRGIRIAEKKLVHEPRAARRHTLPAVSNKAGNEILCASACKILKEAVPLASKGRLPWQSGPGDNSADWRFAKKLRQQLGITLIVIFSSPTWAKQQTRRSFRPDLDAYSK